MSGSVGFLRVFTYPVLSSEVGDLQFRTDQEYAEIAIYGGFSLDAVYREKLFPDSDGVCTAYQLGDVITQWMIDYCFTFREFAFQEVITNTTVFVKVLLCRFVSMNRITGFQYVSNKALLSSEIVMVPHDGKFRFHFYADSSTDEHRKVTVDVSAVSDDGAFKQCSLELESSLRDENICSVTICPDSIIDDLNESLELEDQLSEITMLTVSAKSDPEKKAVACVRDDVDYVCFGFLNQFGLMESLYLHADVSPETVVEAESAVIGHRNIKYDVEQSAAFKVEAINIPSQVWERLVAFLTSPEIYEDATGLRIFLSDISQTPPKTYDSLGSLKFSFSYEDDRLIL